MLQCIHMTVSCITDEECFFFCLFVFWFFGFFYIAGQVLHMLFVATRDFADEHSSSAD